MIPKEMNRQSFWENELVNCQFETNQSGQPIRITGRHGEAFSLTYTGEHLTKVTDALEHAVSFAYGGGYLTAAVNPKGNMMSFVYDENGRITEIKDFSRGIYLTNQYDVFDRVISQTMAGRSVSTAVYSDGLTIFTDEAGNATKYYYNAAGCITRIEFEGTSRLKEQGMRLKGGHCRELYVGNQLYFRIVRRLRREPEGTAFPVCDAGRPKERLRKSQSVCRKARL